MKCRSTIILSLLCVFRSCQSAITVRCLSLNACNGHGRCGNDGKSCVCYDGYGAITDVTTYRSPDCSARTCPAGKSWGSLAVPSAIYAHNIFAECSDKGICDRSLGCCKCSPGFAGPACERSVCPNGCSGHGVCVSVGQMARMHQSLPLSPNTYYNDGTLLNRTSAWDDDKIYGCVCDSSWNVGLGYNETQRPEWFGPDCSFRRCPSGDDPVTTFIETDCYNKSMDGSTNVGEHGNLCHVDCSNRGICDYRSSLCNCFDGYSGANCALQMALLN